MTVTVAGAGMAGLVAAARLHELGRSVVVLEKGTRPGGSLLLSSGVLWRHRTLEDFREECPGGDARLQQAIVDRLDDAIAWLRTKAAPLAEGTGNPRTVGARWDPRALVDSLATDLDVRLETPLAEVAGPTVLATGGFAAELARERGLLLRAAPWSTGDGIEAGRRVGAGERGDRGDFYGRVLPAPPARVGEQDFVRAAQLYGHVAHVVDASGAPIGPEQPAWHEVDMAQAVAGAGGAWFVVDAPNTLAVFVRGPDGAKVEYVEHKPSFALK